MTATARRSGPRPQDLRAPARWSRSYGGVQGEQLDPCYHEACDTYSTVTGQPPASTNEHVPDQSPARAAAGRLAARQGAALARAVQGSARARGLVLHPQQGCLRIVHGYRREGQKGQAKLPIQLPGPSALARALIPASAISAP